MQHLRNLLLTTFLVAFSCALAFCQEVDKDLIIGKWKFVKTTTGQNELPFRYNGDPLLIFERDGHWITEDANPKYKQHGSWKIGNNFLIRDPEVLGMGDIGPYARVIDKLTRSEFVFYAADKGARTFTFYFAKID